MEFTANLPEISLSMGRGAISRAGEICSKYGEIALIVTGKRSMKKLGFLKKLKMSLKSEGIRHAVYSEVPANPTVESVGRAVELAKKNKADMVIALGGGSPMDAAKAIAVGASHLKKGESIWEFVHTDRKKTRIPTSKTLPVIAITSTSGTGSHATPFSVLTNRKTGEKAVIRSKHIFPKESIYDLDVVSKMPKKLTAETGFDVLAHLMESYVSKKANPISEALCEKGIRLVGKWLPKAYKCRSKSAREGMACADTLAGMAISLTGCVAPHSLSHPISGHFPSISHGEALAIISPYLMEWNIISGNNQTVEKYCKIANLLCEKTGIPSKKEAMKSVDAVRKLNKKIGMTRKLSDLGIGGEDIHAFVSDTWECMHGGIVQNPAKLGKRKIFEIYEKAL